MRKYRWIAWAIAFAAWLGLWWYPIGTAGTRATLLALGVILWGGLAALLWRRPYLRWALLGAPVLAAAFLVLPGRSVDGDELRADYARRLRAYEGVTYVWGGEGRLGIDCSGLVRKGLVDAMWRRGLVTFNPWLLRKAVVLWWNDTTARVIGSGGAGARFLFQSASINSESPENFKVGDLAVTASGTHVLAYLGESAWIEADPLAGKVIIVAAPSRDNGWLKTPVRIIRWRILEHSKT